MPKKRKTRKQKVQHDQRGKMEHSVVPSDISSHKTETHADQEAQPQGMTFSLSHTNSIKQAPPQKQTHAKPIAISTDEYGYLSIDLMKTAIVTSAIAITEIVIRILFRG